MKGDGPLTVDCHKAIEKDSAALHTAHATNVHANVRQLSGAPQSYRHQQLVEHADSCVQPGLKGSWEAASGYLLLFLVGIVASMIAENLHCHLHVLYVLIQIETSPRCCSHMCWTNSCCHWTSSTRVKFNTP